MDSIKHEKQILTEQELQALEENLPSITVPLATTQVVLESEFWAEEAVE